MVTLEQLRQLIAVADHGTLSAAAAALLLSQPALSRSMQRLEREFPLPLFERTANQLRLTDAGLLVVEDARRVLEQVDAMYANAHEHERRQRTIDVVSCAPAPLWQLLPQIEQACPGMSLTSRVTTLTEVRRAVAAGDYHLAITTERPPASASAFRCGTEHLYLSVPPAHPAAGHARVRLADLDGETMLLAPNLGYWGDLVRERMPRATFLVQDERAWIEIARASSIPVFTTDWAGRGRNLPNRVHVPIADPEANPTYWCLLNPAQERRLRPLVGGVLETLGQRPN